MLTEPVTCSSCGTVSANGGTLHCHGCYQQFVDGYSALRARVAELEAWQTGVCALIQTASMDGQSILPHELTDAIYHP